MYACAITRPTRLFWSLPPRMTPTIRCDGICLVRRQSALLTRPTRSTSYKIYIAILVSLAMVMCNFMSAGPTVAMVDVAADFNTSVSRAAYFFNNSALLQGVSNLIWVPLLNKYGRRPIYLSAYLLYFFMILGAGLAKTYAGELTTRTILGVGAGAGECLAPVTIADVFYLHQRGYGMA